MQEMEKIEVHGNGVKWLSRLFKVVGLTFLIITWDTTTHGKPVKYGNRTRHSNSSKRHYVVTEEETQDTFFIPHQVPYPVIPHYPVPVITQPAAQPKKPEPKEKHENEHEEEHVLMPPEDANEEHASSSKNSGTNENTEENSGTSVDSTRNTEDSNRNTDDDNNTVDNTRNTGDNNRNTNRNIEDILDTTRNNEIVEKSDNSRNKESTSPQLTTENQKSVKAYRSVGCYKDALPRAVPSLEGSDPVLHGYYKNRLDAVEKCSQAARSRGFQVFTIQNGGFCSSGPMAHRTFQIYGPASNCESGIGGKWASDVYIFNVYAYELTVHTGIEQKGSTDAKISVALYGVMGSSRHIPLSSHISTNVNDPFQSGQVDKFMVHTVPLGDLIRLHICLENRGPTPEWYVEKVSIKDPRNKIFIFPCNCWLKRGKKGSISERNLLPAVVINSEPFKFIGCFKHPKTMNMALDAQDYKILDGRPSTTWLPSKDMKPRNKDYVIEMCAQDAHTRGYTFFAIHNGQRCISSSRFQDTYEKNGKAYDCFETGRGGAESMAVYTITDREPPP